LDYEREQRDRLKRLLGDAFVCFEEVQLAHPILDAKVRADLIALPVEPDFSHLAFAFEVKIPKSDWEFKDWTATIKQASSYVWARVDAQNSPTVPNGRVVSAAFIFPAPYLGSTISHDEHIHPCYRDYDREPLRGALDLAIHFRVGSARIDRNTNSLIELRMGSNSLWTSRSGFKAQARNLLLGKQRIGSRKLDTENLRDFL
jgi:hypothetical protein